jgi:hypothetical protein
MRLQNVWPVFATLVFVCAGAGTSGARAASAKAPAVLEKFRTIFAAAVAAKDRAGVAKLSRFPLAMEGYEMGPKLGERDFLRDKSHFEGIFFAGDAELVKCLRTAPFAYQPDAKQFGAGLWDLDCNGNEYYFGARDGKWAFAAYQNINE